MWTISDTAQVQIKIYFFPIVSMHFCGDWSLIIDDSLSEVIAISNVV